MMYTIEVNYTTGNSLGGEEVTENINLVWVSKDLARKALKSISEHYNMYRSLRRDWVTTDELSKRLVVYDWHKPKLMLYNDIHMWYCYCFVKLDDGSYRTINVSTWCGHFETLHSAKIVLFNKGEDEDEVHFE